MDGLFKVQLNKKDDSDFGELVDSQKYRLRTQKSALLSDLRKKINEGFKELQEPQMTFDLFWKDKEGEYISVDNNESLLDAMKEMPSFMSTFYALMYVGNENEPKVMERTSLSDKGSRVMSIGGELQKCKIIH